MASPWTLSVLKWSDILAEYALYMMITYLTNIWALNFRHAAAIVNVFWGFVAILPIAMRALKDAKIHSLWMLLLSTFAYTTGLGFMAMSAPDASQKDEKCSGKNRLDSNDQCVTATMKTLFFAALPLIVIGKAGFTASLDDFIAQISGITNKILLCFIGKPAIVVVHLIGALAIPYVIKRWSTRFGFPAICMAVGAFLFWIQFASFRRNMAKQSLLGRLCNLIARCFPCFSSSQDNSNTAPSASDQQPNGRLGDLIKSREEVKFFVSLLPLCLLGVVSSIGNTYFIEQGNYMETKIIGPFRVPLLILPAIYYLARWLFPRLYFLAIDICLPPCLRCLRRWCHRVGIALSLLFALLCCVTASRMERRRLHLAKTHGLLGQDRNEAPVPMNILFLVPQFLLLGGLDGLAYESIERFFTDQEIPQSLKPYMVDSAIGVFGVGKILSVLLAYVADKVTENEKNVEGWFADTLNKSRLDNYYWLLAVLTCFNCLWYVFVALRYPPKTSAINPCTLCLPYCCTRRDGACCYSL